MSGRAVERVVEAMLFVSPEPLDVGALKARLPEGADVEAALARLAEHYRERGINLVQLAGGWAFRTAPDVAAALSDYGEVVRRLSRAATETLAIIAYHQPLTRAEIEEIRGVATSRGTLDVLMDAGWIRPGRRRQTPGRPLTWGTTRQFLDHFGLASLDDLPGVEELKAAGLIDTHSPTAVLPGHRPSPGATGDEEEGATARPPWGPTFDGEDDGEEDGRNSG